MQNKNKTIAIFITLILVISMAISISSLETSNAVVINGVNYDQATADAINAGMTWNGQSNNATATRILLWSRFHDQIPTHVYVLAAPNPIGIGQACNLVMFNPQLPPDASLTNTVRYRYTLSITKPDGTVQNFPGTGGIPSYSSWSQNSVVNGVFESDSTGSTYMTYTPDQIGNYSVTVYFQKLQYLWNSSAIQRDYYGTTFLGSNYTVQLTVQNDPVALTGLPYPANVPTMPTEYWSRPIEGQNTLWYQVASNWLNNAHDRDNGGNLNKYQPDGTSPTTGHILWTRPTEDNGVVGGSNTGRSGNTFNAGAQYQSRFVSQIIMYGRLYYTPNLYSSGASELLDCVDLKTGQLVFETNTTASTGTSAVPQFGYYYSQDDPNEHGIQNPGWLFSTNYAIGYQPERGIAYLHITNVPSGFEAQGLNGENLRYVLTNKGNTTNPNYYISQWNSSKVIPMISSGSNPTSASIDASTAARFDWNISAPSQFNSASIGTITVGAVKVGDILWGYNGSWPTGSNAPSYAFPDTVTIWAINLNKDSLGQLLYMKTIKIDDPAANTNIVLNRADANAGIVIGIKQPDQIFVCYDMHTGEKLWESDSQADTITPYGYYTFASSLGASQVKTAYGMLYTGGYTGSITAYNLTNGNIVWRYEVIPPGSAGNLKESPSMMDLVADGKIYIGTHEHSAETPLEPGNKVRCLNATTGELIWQMEGWAYSYSMATADGVVVYWNNYDAQIYALDKGPTAMTVTAPDTAAQIGASVTIKGTVLDISPGTKQENQAVRFPYGVAAVSDPSQSQWMEYVYMQKLRPNNTTGVAVALSVIDANGNYREIGTTTSNDDGFFSFNWKPDIEGKYTIYASFGGSESYWPSHAVTAFSVDAAAPTSLPTQALIQSVADTYLLPGIVVIIVAIAISGAILALLVTKKRP